MKFRLEVHLVPEYIRNLVPVSRYHGNWLTVRGSLSCGRIGPSTSLWKFGITSEEGDRNREKEEENRRKAELGTKMESNGSSGKDGGRGEMLKRLHCDESFYEDIRHEMHCKKIEHLEQNYNNLLVILDIVNHA